MAELFLQNIDIKKVRNIENFIIPLSAVEKKHLIITGKNGSGKTSLLNSINRYLSTLAERKDFSSRVVLLKEYDQLMNKESLTENEETRLHFLNEKSPLFGGVRLNFNVNNELLRKYVDELSYVMTFFTARREVKMNIPVGINKISFDRKPSTTSILGNSFLQYIVNMKADRSFAKDDGERAAVQSIDRWFEKFENFLKSIFDDSGLQLKFNRKSYNFDLLASDGSLFNFNTLSDGYASIISIISELVMRMEASNNKAYDAYGIVLIDEVETHLHVDLQKKVLPFLTSFFPNIQFVVSTHSPFVLSSISNVIICDLESKTITSDLSKYSYDALIESYFNTDKYSAEVKNVIAEYERLFLLKDRSIEDHMKFLKIEDIVDNMPDFRSDEIQVKIQQIRMANLGQ